MRHTEPTQGKYSGLSWNGKSEGLQYSPGDSTSQGPNGFSDSTLYIPVAQALGQRWSADLTPRLESVEMTRFPSKESSRTAQSATSESMPMGFVPIASQAPFQMSSARSDTIGRSASPPNSVLYNPTAQFDFQSAFDTFQYPGGDELAGNNYQVPTTSGFQEQPTLSLTTGGFDMFPNSHGLPTSMAAASSSISSYVQSAQDSVFFDSPNLGSSDMWDTALLESSSPHSPIAGESWSLPPQMMSTNSPPEYSPIEGRSPRYVQSFPDLVDSPPYKTGDRTIRKPMGPRASKVASDTNARRVSGTEMPEESFKLMGRSSLDADNSARDHHLYHNVTTKSDGLYHCPWEQHASCQHKPEKLKCNYE